MNAMSMAYDCPKNITFVTNRLNSGVNCRESVVDRHEFHDQPGRSNRSQQPRVRVGCLLLCRTMMRPRENGIGANFRHEDHDGRTTDAAKPGFFG